VSSIICSFIYAPRGVQPEDLFGARFFEIVSAKKFSLFLLFAASGYRFSLPLLVAVSGCRLIMAHATMYPIRENWGI